MMSQTAEPTALPPQPSLADVDGMDPDATYKRPTKAATVAE